MRAPGDPPEDDDPVVRNRSTHPRRHKDRDAVSTGFTGPWLAAMALALGLATLVLVVVVALR